MTRTSRRLLATLVALLLLGGACGGDDDGDGDAKDTTTTTTAVSASGSSTSSQDGATTTSGGGATTTVAGGSATTTTATPAGGESDGVIELVITGGNVEGGVRREKVAQGSQVTIRATSDVADELHVHGYDLKLDLEPNRSSDLTFLAKIPGVFEVELEGRGKKVLELEVRA